MLLQEQRVCRAVDTDPGLLDHPGKAWELCPPPQICFYKKSLTPGKGWCTLTSHPDESEECASASLSPPLFLGCTNSQWFVKLFAFYFKAQGSITLGLLEVFQIPVKPQPEISYFLLIWSLQNNASNLFLLCIIHKAMDHWLISVSHFLGFCFVSYILFPCIVIMEIAVETILL